MFRTKQKLYIEHPISVVILETIFIKILYHKNVKKDMKMIYLYFLCKYNEFEIKKTNCP